MHYFTRDVLRLIKLVYTGKWLLKLDTSTRFGHQQHALLIHCIHCQGDRLQEQQRSSTKGYSIFLTYHQVLRTGIKRNLGIVKENWSFQLLTSTRQRLSPLGCQKCSLLIWAVTKCDNLVPMFSHPGNEVVRPCDGNSLFSVTIFRSCFRVDAVVTFITL